MRTGLLCITTAVLLVGCRSRMDPSVDLLESELRWLEDQVYLLDDQLQQTCAQLASCRRENETLRQTLEQGSTTPAISNSYADPNATGKKGASSPPQPVPRGKNNAPPPTIPRRVNPKSTEEPPSQPSIDELQPPNVELGEPGPPPAALNGEGGLNRFGASSDITHFLTRTQRQTDGEAMPEMIPTDLHVDRIVLNRQLTGGYDFDDRPGEEGLFVVIEPQNRQGEYIPVAGPLTLWVTDPSDSSHHAAKVAQWTFSSVETGQTLRRSVVGRGIHLQLPWPGKLPDRPQLTVHASYETSDGRRLDAQHRFDRPTSAIETHPPHQVATLWHPDR